MGPEVGESDMTKSTWEFPCEMLPAEAGDQKLLGLYPQRQEGLWLQRIKILGGRLTASQWSGLARIARDFTPQTPLHLTTRQDVEIHDLTASQVPEVQRALDALGMTTLGAAGDTARNVTVCPCAGQAAGSADLVPLAEAVQRTVTSMAGIYDLPRKFKMAFACSEGCGQPWINDLGFVAKQRDGEWGFAVMAAGSLGAKPGTGIALFDWLAAGEVLPLAVAAVEFFAAEGDRENRRKARLRHVRERMGDDAFADALRAKWAAVQSRDSFEAVTVEAAAGLAASRVLTFANGDVTSEMASALGQLAGREGLSVVIGNQHRVWMFGASQERLGESLAEFAALARASEPQASVVSCPGTKWCPRALVSTREAGDAIRAALGGLLAPAATVCISGCPNGCAHSAVGDIGLSGCLTTQQGHRHEAFRVTHGGGMGRDARLGQLTHPSAIAADIVEILRTDLTPKQESP